MLGQFTRDYTQTVKRAADNKRRYAPGKGHSAVLLWGYPKGAYCRYFQEAVLPLDPALEAALSGQGPAPETRPCPVCGRPALLDGRRRYCSEACARAALREQKRDYMRKKRGW